ncbi:MAG: N-acetylmuramoyl-L-alanine amidase [Methyloprofundus sp.]|nr:N-acetylmuramoyl-L-alanine amidase [Methyloprofundus sp.]
MKKIIIIWLLTILYSSFSFAAQTRVNGVRIRTSSENTRLVFDVSRTPEYKIFQLKKPARLVVDFNNTKLTGQLKLPKSSAQFITGLRTARRGKNSLRVVFDLQKNITPKSFILKATKKAATRLVIDLPNKNKKAQVVKASTRKIKPFIVAVDAGHGGKDPGAHGQRGTLEKTVVFQIAQKLTNIINKNPNMQAFMVRKGDYFISLKERSRIARRKNADLFISIHADAFSSPKASGASVFTLSRRGATSEAARWLANHENAADLMGGVRLDDKDDILASVLLDLSQSASQNISQLVAKEVLANFGRIGKLHSKTVQKAGFRVLKSPDVPSILVETAYISNPEEERRLKSSRYQYKLANAINKGVVSYAKKHTIAFNTTVKETSHKIARGDTLLGIALKYGVSLDQLKRANTIARSNKIKIGQFLTIPL